jgi:hypothetical protein
MINDNFPESFYQAWKISSKTKRPPRPKEPIKVVTLESLKSLIQQGYRVQDLDVRGNTTRQSNSDQIHPVVRALHQRALEKSMPGKRNDSRKVALAIEGGGMRGCVAAGMITVCFYIHVFFYLLHLYTIVYFRLYGILVFKIQLMLYMDHLPVIGFISYCFYI